MKFTRSAALFAAVAATSPSAVFGLTRLWSGDFSTTWITPINWQLGAEPLPTDRAFFDLSAVVERVNVVLPADRTILAMAVQGIPPPGPYSFSRQNNAALTINGFLEASFDAGSVNFSGFQATATDIRVFGARRSRR